MKILVTGGLGFIGSNFIRYMLSEHPDCRIINLDKVGLGAKQNNLKEVENDRRYEFIKGSITNRRLISKLTKEVDVIVNLAAETHVDRSISNPKPFFLSNTLGVFTILEALREHNPKALFVHISTDETYGDIKEGSFNEESRLKPSNPYSASKAAADMFILAYHRTYNINTFILRPTNNFGPYQFPEKLIPKTVIRASRNLSIPIYGKGTNVRDWLYVTDTCKAIELIMYEGEPGEIYNVSAGNEYSNLEVVKKILKMMNKPETLITFVEDRPGHDVRYSLDSTKIRKLGWKPQYGFENALEYTVKWYMENEWWWKPIASEDILSPIPWRLRW